MALGITERTRRYNARRPWNEQTGEVDEGFRVRQPLPDNQDPGFIPQPSPNPDPGFEPNQQGIYPRDMTWRVAEPAGEVSAEASLAPEIESILRPKSAAPPATTTAPAAKPSRTRALLEQLRAERDAGPAKDQNGRFKSALWNAFQQMSARANQVLASGRPIDEYGLASVLGSGLGGGIRGVFDPAIDDELKRQARMADLEHQITQQVQLEQEQAQTERMIAETEYLKQKPQLEAEKAEATRLNRERQAFFSRLRIKRGMPLSDDDIKDGAALGITLDAQEWLNSPNNIITATVTDPKDPTRTDLVRINKVTGEQWRQDQKGFQQPVGQDGMTAHQRASIDIREQLVKIAEERNRISREALDLRRTQQEADALADQYEGEALAHLASILENNSQPGDADDEATAKEKTQQREEARKLRAKAVELLQSGRAKGGANKGGAPKSTVKPKSDPLGLFK